MVDLNLLPGPARDCRERALASREKAAELRGFRVSPPMQREPRHLLQTTGGETPARRMLDKGGSQEELGKRVVLNVKIGAWKQRDFSDGTEQEESCSCLSHPRGCSSTLRFWF